MIPASKIRSSILSSAVVNAIFAASVIMTIIPRTFVNTINVQKGANTKPIMPRLQ